MRRLVSAIIFLFLIVAAIPAEPLAAQDDTGHVFVANFWRALPGKAGEYSRFAAEFSHPYYDELIKQGAMVDFQFVAAWTGSADYSHLFIAEYENWDAVDAERDGAAACQAAFGMTCAEKRAEIGIEDLATVREFVRREVWGSLRPGG